MRFIRNEGNGQVTLRRKIPVVTEVRRFRFPVESGVEWPDKTVRRTGVAETE